MAVKSLHIAHLLIHAALVQQLSMRARLQNPTVEEDKYPIGVTDRTQSVSDSNRDAIVSLGRGHQGLLNHTLRLCIESASCLIKQDDLGVPYESPCNSDALSLAAGELASTGTAGRVESLGQGGDEIPRIGSATGGFDLRLGGRFPGDLDVHAERDVFANAAGEQGGFLLDEGQPAAVETGVYRVQRGRTVDCDRSGIRVVESFQKSDHSALATPGRANKGNKLTAFNLGAFLADGPWSSEKISSMEDLLTLREMPFNTRILGASGYENWTLPNS
jgi:hypothetical protein